MSQITFRLLNANEIEVRVGQKFNSGKVSLLLYQDSRCAMNILDETVGSENWACNYTRQGDSLFCSIGIYSEKHKAFIFKSDAGSESNFEKTKGEASDAFKRAAVKWGIARELYTAPKIIVPCENEYERFYVENISYDENSRICDLQIVNSKGEIVFNYRNGLVCKVVDIDPVELLSTVCKELKESGEDYKELGRFYKYYENKIGSWDNVSEKTVRKLWTKWNSR